MNSLEVMKGYLPSLINALPTTFYLLFVSVFLAAILAFVLTAAVVGNNRICKGIANLYVSFMRGTPMMIQLLLVFIFIPTILNYYGYQVAANDNMTYAIIAFTLNEAAYFSEIFRSAYLALDKGQIEAAKSLGMDRIQVFRRVIFPQAAATALPNTTNMIIELMKNTSIAMVIGVYDIMGKAVQLAKNNYGVGQKEVFIEVALLFWIIGLIIMFISNRITGRLNRGNSNYMNKKVIFKLRKEVE